ncbi:MAG: hypothetical protein JWM00_415 [Candidatus Saccharibacteria bacterium]|nr:hypothetical protein [Candidatus Saccharibacteria bacterium]
MHASRLGLVDVFQTFQVDVGKIAYIGTPGSLFLKPDVA